MKAHILIVADDPSLIRMLAFILADSGYQTSARADPDGVLRFLDEQAVNLVLLDALLPRTDSLALCSAIQRAHPDIPIIFHSARSQLVGGGDDSAAVPFEPMELLARIRAVLYRP